MNSDEWLVFDGIHQYGPYDLDQIKSLIFEQRILPETLVWKLGMDDWLEASCLDNFSVLFDQGDGLRSAHAEPPPAITKPRLMTPSVQVMGDGHVVWQTSGARLQKLDVGMSRKDYLYREIVITCAFGMAAGFPLLMNADPVPIVGFLVLMASGILMLFAKVRRLSNLGWNSWLIALYFVPIVNLCALVIDWGLFAAPADFAKTKRLDTTGWILLAIYPFTTLLKIALVILMFVGRLPI